MINLAISAFLCALIALFFDLEKLVEFMSIGTLLAYTIVSASVVILRYRPTNRGLVRDSSSLLELPTSQADVSTFKSRTVKITPKQLFIRLNVVSLIITDLLLVFRNGHGRTSEAVIQIPRTRLRRLRTRKRRLYKYRLVYKLHGHPVRLHPILVQHATRKLDGRHRHIDFGQRFTYM